jgi:hypothetical protein
MVGKIVQWVMVVEAPYVKDEYLQEDTRMVKLKVTPDLMNQYSTFSGNDPY